MKKIRHRNNFIFRYAKRSLVGGVNSPVRAFKSVGGDPLLIQRGQGSRIYDVDGNAIGNKKIPVYLTPKEKVVAALQKGNWDTNGSIVVENYLPSISIAWTNIDLDRDRLRGQRNTRRLYIEYESDPDGDGVCDPDCVTEKVHTDIKEVPYKLTYEVNIWAKYMDDMAQILENILPFFR